MTLSRCYTMHQHGQVSSHADRSELAEGVWNLSLGHFLFTMLPTQRYIILSPLLKLLLFSCSVVFDSLWPYGLQHARLPCPSQSPRICSNSRPLNLWCHPTIWSSVVAFSSCFTFLSSQTFLNLSSLLLSLLYFLRKALFNYHEQVSVGIISHFWIMKLPSETYCKEDLV